MRATFSGFPEPSVNILLVDYFDSSDEHNSLDLLLMEAVMATYHRIFLCFVLRSGG